MILLDPPFLGEDASSGLPVLMVAVEIAGSSCVFLTVDSEGEIRLVDCERVKSDWRYDYDKREWYDRGSQKDE
jgi:hypothetical protein